MNIQKNTIRKCMLKNKCKDILVKYELTNNDYGFFSQYKEVYFPKKGIKITSTLENISYSLKEVDYYLLENKKIVKFIRHDSLNNSYRELIEEYTISNYKKRYKNKNALLAYQALEQQLLQV